MKRALLAVLLFLVVGAGSVGCGDSAQTRDLGITGLELYYKTLVGSPFWPEGVEPLSAEEIDALASTTWDAGEWAVARAKEELKNKE